MRAILLTVSSILGFTLCACTGLADGEAVKVTVKPDTVYVERSETGQHLNFDFLLENRTDRELLLTGVELSLSAGERVCLVGRNGSGKSTLLKIAAGLVEADGGTRFVQPGTTVATMRRNSPTSCPGGTRLFTIRSRGM